MTHKQIIAVFGATGAQGGGLVDAILADPSSNFTVRAITRDVNSAKAKALAARGAEVVAADFDSPDTLAAALHGAYGAFVVTNFWEHMSAEKEFNQATAAAKAAKAAGVKHVVFSTLEDTRKWMSLSDERMPTLQGKYKVPHFDAKGEVEHVFTDEGVPTTFVNTSFYWENLITFGMGPQKQPDGSFAMTLPMGDKKLPGIAVADIGASVYGVFKDPSLIGKTIGIAGDHPTIQQMVDEFARHFPDKKFVYNAVDPNVYRSFGFPGADEMGNMFQVKRDFNDTYCGNRPLATTKALNPGVHTFSSWLAKNIGSFKFE